MRVSISVTSPGLALEMMAASAYPHARRLGRAISNGRPYLIGPCARYDVHPNLIANWKKKAREQVLASFSENKERQEGSRESEIKELRAKIGELVIERDFFSKDAK